MEIKKEDYQRRYDELEMQLKNLNTVLQRLNEQINKAAQDINAVDGAMQECRHWMEKFEEKKIKA